MASSAPDHSTGALAGRRIAVLITQIVDAADYTVEAWRSGKFRCLSTAVRNYGDVFAGRKTPSLAMCLWSWDLPANTSLYLRTRVLRHCQEITERIVLRCELRDGLVSGPPQEGKRSESVHPIVSFRLSRSFIYSLTAPKAMSENNCTNIESRSVAGCVDVRACRAKYKALAPALTERARRIWAATEARAAGRGGITGVVRATGIAYSTIQRGLKELEAKVRLAPGRIRRPGGGRKRTLTKDPTLLADLEGLVEPTASGDPTPLRWTSKSVRHLAEALQRMGHRVSRQLVAELLAEAGYSLQANRKTREGASHPDRDAQFRYVNEQVRRFQSATQPVISVDTKKKELVGDFKNQGRQWRPRGQPPGCACMISSFPSAARPFHTAFRAARQPRGAAAIAYQKTPNR
jgi:Rhodopirellula transposase DDE domain